MFHASPYLRKVWQEAALARLTDAFDDCPVAVPPSALMDEMRHGLLPWPLRGRRGLVPDLDVPELPGE